MKVFEAVGKGLALVGKNMKFLSLVIGINIVLLMILMLFLVLIFGSAGLQFSPDGTLAPNQLSKINWAMVGVAIMVLLVIQIFLNGGVIGTIKEIIKSNSMSIGGFFASARNLFGRYLLFTVLSILAGLVVLLIAVLAVFMIGFIGTKVAALGSILGMRLAKVLIIAAFIILAIYANYWSIVIAVEDKKTIESLGIMLKFTKGKMLRSIGLGAAYVIVLILIAIINNLVAMRGGALSVAVQIIVVIVNLYLTTAFAASWMYFYMGNESKKVSSTLA